MPYTVRKLVSWVYISKSFQSHSRIGSFPLLGESESIAFFVCEFVVCPHKMQKCHLCWTRLNPSTAEMGMDVKRPLEFTCQDSDLGNRYQGCW